MDDSRLKALEQKINRLQSLVATARKDTDFDLFYRRLNMAEILVNLPPEAMVNITFQDFYAEYWKLTGEAHRKTKFAEEEKNISRQVLEQAQLEQNPVRRQYLALILILFGELQTAQPLIDQKFCSPQLLNDLATFIKWNDLANNQLPLQALAKIAHNNQVLAFLQDKYSALIKKYSQAVINEETCPHVKDYQIYFCWLQGEEHLPPLVRCCYNSLRQNAGRYKVCFIDEQNFSNYVDIAPHIMDKFRAGKISRTHFSDILRVNLLERHGGLWLDSTILVTEPLENHKDFWEMPYFTQRFYREKSLQNNFAHHVTFGRWASFIQGTAIRHSPLFAFGKEFFDTYWRDFDELIDYLLIDFMMALAYDNIPAVTKIFDAVPINNTGIYFIQSHLSDSYAAYPFDKILKDTFLHKLSWKIPLDAREDTVFREIQRRYT